MPQPAEASSIKLASRDQDLDHGGVDHLFGEVARDTGEGVVHVAGPVGGSDTF